MSKYTTEVRFICEELNDLNESAGYKSVDEIVENALPFIFDFDFPIFDEEYRTVLEKHIIKHFYVREIGLETVGLWKLYLDNKLNDIMPYYNEMYKTTLWKYNPLYDVDYYTDSEDKGIRKDDNTRTDNLKEKTKLSGKDTTNNSNENVRRYSDTPQGDLNGIMGKGSEKTDTIAYYLTEGEIIDDNGSEETLYGKNTKRINTGTQKNSGTIKTHDKYGEHVYGKKNSKSYPSIVAEFRKNLINVDMMIIEELEPLFMQLW